MGPWNKVKKFLGYLGKWVINRTTDFFKLLEITDSLIKFLYSYSYACNDIIMIQQYQGGNNKNKAFVN